jgi:hypothetical protein
MTCIQYNSINTPFVIHTIINSSEFIIGEYFFAIAKKYHNNIIYI